MPHPLHGGKVVERGGAYLVEMEVPHMLYPLHGGQVVEVEVPTLLRWRYHTCCTLCMEVRLLKWRYLPC